MESLPDTVAHQRGNATTEIGSNHSATTSREARLQAVLHELERRFGPWIVYRLRDARPIVHDRSIGSRSISSGSLAIDRITQIGGFPRGRITEIVGPTSSGKSTFSFHLLATTQRQGELTAFIDAAHRVSFEHMERCGVQLPDLFLVVPETVPEALDIAALLAESGGLGALVIGPLSDLVGGSLPLAHQAAEKVARLNALMTASPTVVVFLTDNDIPSPVRPSLAPVSRALRHFASLRIQLVPTRRIVHPSGDVTGLRVRVEVVKNKLASPHQQAEVDLRWDRGVHREAELVDLGLASAVLEERGLGICFASRLLGRGRARAIATLESDPSLARDLQESIRQTLLS